MRSRVKTTKASLHANRIQLNDLADTVRSIAEFDSAHRHEMQDQIEATDKRIIIAQSNVKSLQGTIKKMKRVKLEDDDEDDDSDVDSWGEMPDDWADDLPDGL